MLRAMLIAALAMVPSGAMAQNESCGRLPPSRYRHEPTEPYAVHYVRREELRKYCNNGLWAYAPTPGACAILDTRQIYIPDDLTGAMLRCVLTHEKAHLNGWAWNHPIR